MTKQVITEDKVPVREFKFTPKVEFEWVRNGRVIGHYIPGMSYNCTNQPRHDELRSQCEAWDGAGMITRHYLPDGERFVIKEVV